MTPWIAVDFDRTLAEYHDWSDELGAPIAPMVERVKNWLAEGKTVKIFTARVGCSGITTHAGTDDEEWCDNQRRLIRAWCLEHIGQELEVTATKDLAMIELWDDLAVRVEANTGRVLSC